jgi:hypothetical protein
MSSQAAFAPMANSPDVQEEMATFEEYEASLINRSSDKMSRKRLMYDSLSRRNSRKLT